MTKCGNASGFLNTLFKGFSYVQKYAAYHFTHVIHYRYVIHMLVILISQTPFLLSVKIPAYTVTNSYLVYKQHHEEVLACIPSTLHHHTLSYCHACVICDLSWLHGGEWQQLETMVYLLVIEQAHDVSCSQQSIPLFSITSRMTLNIYCTRLLIRSREQSTVQDSEGCHSELKHKTHCRKCSSISSRHRISPVPFAGRWTHHRLNRSDVKYCKVTNVRES